MKFRLLLLSTLFIGMISYGQTAKVIGYLPSYRFYASNEIEYCKLTHLNLSFANPDSSGNLQMQDYSSVMSDALNANPSIIICLSLGGAGLTEQQKDNWSRLIDIPSNRPAFILKIVDYLVANNLDGVDMDLEWGDVTSGYSGFVTELDTALNSIDKLLTVAFPSKTLYSNVSRDALNAFDFINIMAYDQTGPWRPQSPGQHSSFDFASQSIDFWEKTAGVPREKLTLGVPFYGYDFVSTSTVNTVTYKQMVAADPAYADLDTVGKAYYNGRPTIEAKVNLANEKVAGIMIWEIGQNSFDEYSLLSTIHNKYTSLGITTTGLCGNEYASMAGEEIQHNFKIYPNPCSAYVTIELADTDPSEVIITNFLGQIINFKSSALNENELFLNVSEFPKGLYFIKTTGRNKAQQVQKIVVI